MDSLNNTDSLSILKECAVDLYNTYIYTLNEVPFLVALEAESLYECTYSLKTIEFYTTVYTHGKNIYNAKKLIDSIQLILSTVVIENSNIDYINKLTLIKISADEELKSILSQHSLIDPFDAERVFCWKNDPDQYYDVNYRLFDQGQKISQSKKAFIKADKVVMFTISHLKH